MAYESKKQRLQIKKNAGLILRTVKTFLGRMQIEGRFQKLHDDGFWLAFAQYVEREGPEKLRGYPTQPLEWAERHRVASRVAGRYKPRKKMFAEQKQRDTKVKEIAAELRRAVSGVCETVSVAPEMRSGTICKEELRCKAGKVNFADVYRGVFVPNGSSLEFARTTVVVHLVKELLDDGRDISFSDIGHMQTYMRGDHTVGMLRLLVHAPD